MALLRIDKIIADCGIASRKEAATLVKRGCVLANGVPVKSASDKFNPDRDEIIVNGESVSYQRYHYVMMNKPQGYISATEDRSESTVLDLLDDTYRKFDLFPAGRLDKDAVGLMLLTNDGDYSHRIISPNKHVDKIYFVRVEGKLQKSDCVCFEEGIELKDGLVCRPGKLTIVSDNEAFVMIHEGKYHQVKRMLASLGKPVIYLKRCCIGQLVLDTNLEPGEYREMTQQEVEAVFQKPEVDIVQQLLKDNNV